MLLRLNLKQVFIFSEHTPTEGVSNCAGWKRWSWVGKWSHGVTCLRGMLSGLNAEFPWPWRWPFPRQSVGLINGRILVTVALANFMVGLFGHLNNQSGYKSSGGLDDDYSGIKVRRGVSCKGSFLRTGHFAWECDPKLWTSPSQELINGAVQKKTIFLRYSQDMIQCIWRREHWTPWSLNGTRWPCSRPDVAVRIRKTGRSHCLTRLSHTTSSMLTARVSGLLA